MTFPPQVIAAWKAAKIAGRVAVAVAKAKLIANFRKWNRGDTGKEKGDAEKHDD